MRPATIVGMPKEWVSAIMVVLFCSSAMAQSTQRKTWEYAGRGQWPEVQTPATQPFTPSPELDRVEQLISLGNSRLAIKDDVAWLLANKTHPQRDRALFLAARAFYLYGDRIKAFYYCDELLDEYPQTPYYRRALELQYDIADQYLLGYKIRFLGIPAFNAFDEAIEMLYRIQNRSPGSPLAERSMLRTADFYFADRQYDLAGDTYGAFVRTYPRSPQIPRAKLREALSLYAQSRGPKYDATPLIDAREHLRAIAVQYPDLAAEENVSALLVQIDHDLAEKLYLTADFYRRTHDPRAAVYTYRYLLKAFPESTEAKLAHAALARLPDSAKQQTPQPAIMPDFEPATPPPGQTPAMQSESR